jgi:hypothetical protein
LPSTHNKRKDRRYFLVKKRVRKKRRRERERAEVTPKVQIYGHVLFLLYSTATHNNNNGT